MKRSIAVLLILAARAAVASASCQSAAIHVRSPRSEMRIWQACTPSNGVIQWRWEGASAARLVVTSLLDRVVFTPDAIYPAEGQNYGSWTLPSRTGCADGLYDMVLVLDHESGSKETLCARVAALSDGWTLRFAGSKDWRKIGTGESRLLAYDAKWNGDPDIASSAEMRLSSCGLTKDIPLTGIAGWHNLDVDATLPGCVGDVTAKLYFDAIEEYAASLFYGAFGTRFLLR